MSNVTGTIRGRATVQESQSPVIYNVTVLLPNIEVVQLLNDSTKSFSIRVRGVSKLQLAFVAGQSGTKYITIGAGCTYIADGLNFSGSLYFQTTQASQVVEILEWT